MVSYSIIRIIDNNFMNIKCYILLLTSIMSILNNSITHSNSINTDTRDNFHYKR